MFPAGLAKRVVALAAALMFDLCIRYDELARLKTDALFFVPNGVLVLVGIRKNKQAGTQCFLPISDTGPTGTVALLRSVLRQRWVVPEYADDVWELPQHLLHRPQRLYHPPGCAERDHRLRAHPHSPGRRSATR